MKQKVSLIKLMKEGRFDLVRILVCYNDNKDFEFDFNECDEEGVFAFEYAIIYGKEGIAMAMMNHNPHCSFVYNHGEGNRPSPAGLAIKFHRIKVLQKMIEDQSFGEKPRMYFVHSCVYKDIPLLMYAVMYKSLAAVSMLLDAGAEIGIGQKDGTNVLSVAAIRAVGHGEHSTQNLIFRELLHRLAGHNAKVKIITRALEDLRAYAKGLTNPEAISKVEMILESARMY